MKRRSFIKSSLAAGMGMLLPNFTYAEGLDLSKINFSTGISNANNAQTIIVFLYGGSSQLGANLTNIEEIEAVSEKSYSFFGSITPTPNKLWQEAGGNHMESLLANGDMTLFRTCYSEIREKYGSRDHGTCTVENQRGTFEDVTTGILTNLALVLEKNGIVNQDTLMPFVTFDGNSTLYESIGQPLSGYLRPVGLTHDLSNPYLRFSDRWDDKYYTATELENPDHSNSLAALHSKMDALAQANNAQGEIKSAFSSRTVASAFIDSLATVQTPDLGADAYPDSTFSKTMETAIKVLSHNPDTKVATVQCGDGWDDHESAEPYIDRIEDLFHSLKSAMAHIKAVGKEQNINVLVFSEFGRNVNLNVTYGWDHGNLQNVYVLGGNGYFNHKGIVGETMLDVTSDEGVNRLYMRPEQNSYKFEPMSIAATLYKIYGIENPEVLTGGYGEITPLFG